MKIESSFHPNQIPDDVRGKGGMVTPFTFWLAVLAFVVGWICGSAFTVVVAGWQFGGG